VPAVRLLVVNGAPQSRAGGHVVVVLHPAVEDLAVPFGAESSVRGRAFLLCAVQAVDGVCSGSGVNADDGFVRAVGWGCCEREDDWGWMWAGSGFLGFFVGWWIRDTIINISDVLFDNSIVGLPLFIGILVTANDTHAWALVIHLPFTQRLPSSPQSSL
jgi:hypothetical protein